MPNYPHNRRRIALLIIIIGALFGVKHANAFTLSPVRMEISGNPGEVLKEEMLLTNESEGETNYFSSFANFEAQGESGNPSFVEATTDLGSWISIDSSITLKAKEEKKVQFTIRIPENAEPGGHFAAIFWGTAPNKPGSVSIGAKTGILVLLSVNGDVKEAGGLLSFSTVGSKFFYNTLPVSFEYRFKNDGGDRIKPVGKVIMHDLFYIPEDRIDANSAQGNILPSSTRKFSVDWIKSPRSKDYVAPNNKVNRFFNDALYQWRNFAIGPYMAKIDLLYGTEAIRVSKHTFFFVFPWQLLICLVVIFIIIFWGGRKLIKRYNRHIIQKARSGMSMPNDKPSHV